MNDPDDKITFPYAMENVKDCNLLASLNIFTALSLRY